MSAKTRLALAASASALIALAVGCGSTSHHATTQGTVTATASPPPSPSPSPSPQYAKVGDTLSVSASDSKYDVTLLSVVQQAQPDSEFDAPPAGRHLAGVQFRVTATTAVDENANNNTTAIGSDDQVYTASLYQVAEGTNFASGAVTLQPGASLIGWVPIEVPNAVKIARVRWTPGSGFGTKAAEWAVNTASPGSSPTAATPASPTGGGSPTATAPTATAPASPAAGPEATVIAYFDAINLRDYMKAWQLGGKNTTSSYSSFVSGFKTTASVSVQILDLSGDIGTAVVTARVTSVETDGTSKVFQGTYTVRDSVITEFNVRQVS